MSASTADVAAVRAALLGRCELTSAWALQPLGDIPSPEAWPCPPRAVAEIRSVIAGIVASLAELRANAETARATAGRLRDAALAAGSNPLLVSAAYDTLLATIDQIEARKTVAFETELVAGDAVLEATEAELSAIGELASGSSNEDLIRLRDTLAPDSMRSLRRSAAFQVGLWKRPRYLSCLHVRAPRMGPLAPCCLD